MKARNKKIMVCKCHHVTKRPMLCKRITIIRASPLELQKSMEEVCIFSDEIKKQNSVLCGYKHSFFND